MSQLPTVRQESHRLNPTFIIVVMLLTLLFSAVLLVGAWAVLHEGTGAGALAPSVERPATPVPEVSSVRSELFRQRAAGEALKDRQRATLRNYSWVDRARGIVRVPIDVAMQLVAEEGHP